MSSAINAQSLIHLPLRVAELYSCAVTIWSDYHTSLIVCS